MQKEFHTAKAPAPTTHAYDDPDLSPVEFLRAVMHATHLPMASRVQAASAVLPYTNSFPRSVVPPRCKIVIPPLSLEPWSHICSPWPREGDRGSGSADDPTRNHSQNPFSPNITLTRDDDTVAPQNIETTFHPQSFTDYSTPPTPAELQEIKAAINALRPDLAELRSSQPEPRLCSCGHWMFGPCPLGERCRDKSKLN
jgi:hypothetical protein